MPAVSVRGRGGIPGLGGWGGEAWKRRDLHHDNVERGLLARPLVACWSLMSLWEEMLAWHWPHRGPTGPLIRS